jgi:hypothetical protein
VAVLANIGDGQFFPANPGQLYSNRTPRPAMTQPLLIRSTPFLDKITIKHEAADDPGPRRHNYSGLLGQTPRLPEAGALNLYFPIGVLRLRSHR